MALHGLLLLRARVEEILLSVLSRFHGRRSHSLEKERLLSISYVKASAERKLFSCLFSSVWKKRPRGWRSSKSGFACGVYDRPPALHREEKAAAAEGGRGGDGWRRRRVLTLEQDSWLAAAAPPQLQCASYVCMKGACLERNGCL